MSKQNFTKELLDNIALPEKGKRLTLYDSKARGLCVIAQPTGVKSFYVLRKVERRTERFHLGRYPDTKIEQARKRAGEINSRIDAGENPNEVKRQRRASPTLSEFFHGKYTSDHLVPHTRRPENTHMNFKLLRKLENKTLVEISSQDIKKHMMHLEKALSPVSANKMHALIRAIYNQAIAWGDFEGVNPAVGVRRYREISRDRFLQPDELPRFLKAVYEESDETIRDFVLVLLFTGARRHEVQEMRWEQINFEMRYWSVLEAKNGESRNVSLVDEAMSLLQERKKLIQSEWVFPGEGVTGHLVEPKKGWKRILERAEIQNLRIHDLRRTMGSWMTAGGANMQTIAKALGHKSLQSTEIYARLNLDPVREAQQAAVGKLLSASGQQRNLDE